MIEILKNKIKPSVQRKVYRKKNKSLTTDISALFIISVYMYISVNKEK